MLGLGLDMCNLVGGLEDMLPGLRAILGLDGGKWARLCMAHANSPNIT